MEYFLSILIGLGISIILLLAPIFTGVFGKFPWVWYVALAIYIPFLDFNVPVLPYVLISAAASFCFFKMNVKYNRNQAMITGSEWAARCQASYFFLVIGSYLVSWFVN
jgi:hypothetical protein|tara:strand:+ start:178 stop:501 length:324 start_codon:yes stop_codon:yes gene_type:complete